MEELNLSIKVEFLAATDIKVAIEQAKMLAQRLGVAYIIFNFNGIRFSIGPNANIELALEDFRFTKEGGSIIYH